MKNQIKMFLSSGKTIPQLIKKSLKKIDKNEDYIDSVLRYDIWSNNFEQSIPIYQIYHHVHKFVDECEIKDHKAVSPDGKIRKVFFSAMTVCVPIWLLLCLQEKMNLMTALTV